MSGIQPLPRHDSLSVEIAKKLHDMILDGTLLPGSFLPGQRDLAKQFGASMASVRGAISALDAAGLIKVSPGKSTIICSLKDTNSIFDGWLGVAEEDRKSVV